MALGMTRDSMADLQNLVNEKENEDESQAEDTVSLLTTGQSTGSQREYSKLIAHGPVKPGEVEEEQQPPSEEMEELTKRLSMIGESSSDANGSIQAAAPQDARITRSPSTIEEDDDDDDEEEEKKQDVAPTGMYAGFKADYDAYDYDPYQIHYSHTPTLLGGKKASSGFLCCLFPWLTGNNLNSRIKDAEDDSSLEKTKTEDANGSLRKSSSLGEEDDMSVGDVSVGSSKLGEKLSDRERQAVLARLRLAQPDGSPDNPKRLTGAFNKAGPNGTCSEDSTTHQKGLLSEIPNPSLKDNGSTSETSNGSYIKGILKRTSVTKKPLVPQKDANNGRRRSLFPVYETNRPKKQNQHNVQFAPMARVVTVKSQKDMSEDEKSQIWWQKWDYEDFRKTGRIITRAMLEGGSEIWLASNQSWQHMGASKSETLKNAMNVAEQGGGENNSAADIIRTTGDKWWHKFGHSRRGLEHIASMKEGAERQANVRHAIKATLDELRRQKTYMREDPEKLRIVSIHNTSWARDLALAAGQSDADAVKSEFVEDRKSREFYLLKMARSNQGVSQGKHVPAFMKPSMTSLSHKLDANTSAQIRDRQKQHRQQLSLSSSSKVASAAIKNDSTTNGDRTMEAIHDANDGGVDLAKRAAGFSHTAEHVNMAAVLSGMGAVSKIAQPV